MGLTFESDNKFSQKVFDVYTSKLEHKEEQGHRDSAKITGKLQFTKEEIGKTVYGKRTSIFNEQGLGLGQASAQQSKILQMNDAAFEVEKNRVLADMIAADPKTKVNSASVQREIRKQIAQKYGAKYVRTDSELKAEKNNLRHAARDHTASMHRRVRVAETVKRGAAHVVTDQGAAREKDLGTESLIKANQYTRRLRRELVYLAFTPESAIRTQRLSKLERKQTKLEGRQNKKIMQEFFNDVHQNEAAVMHSLYNSKGMRKEALHTRFRTRSDYGGHVKSVGEIKNFTEKNRDVILKEMQKKNNRKQYRKAAFGNKSSKMVQADRKKLFKQTGLFARAKEGGKSLVGKLVAGCLIPFMVGCGLLAFLFIATGLLFANILSSSNETTSWANITEITTEFTKQETDFVPQILASDKPIQTNVDGYEWYVVIDGTKTEVDSKTAIMDKWHEIGQADQNKLAAFICTLQTDATLEKTQDIIDDIIQKMYSLTIKIDERTEKIDACTCGCQDKESTTTCQCSSCDEGGGEETEYIQVTTFSITNLDSVVDKLYSEYVTPEKKEQLSQYYNTYQITRGGNVSLGNPIEGKWYSGNTPPSSYNGWRFIDRGDGNGYTVEEHKGLDIPAKQGEALYMPFDGTVQEAGNDNSRGNYVILLADSGNTRVTYMHMYTQTVKTGDVKKRAYKVGTVGTTGDSTGPHLHVSVEIKDKSGHWSYVNPLFVFSEERVYKNGYGETE